jgi:hypothetical protein
MGNGSPHVLVSFTSGFTAGSDGSFSSCPLEGRSDSEVVAALMKQLRRAFQGGEERRVGDDHSDATLQGRQVSVARVAVDDTPTEWSTVRGAAAGAGGHETEGTATRAGDEFSIPSAFQRSVPRWSTSAATHHGAARGVPDPVGYLVTRWGLEPYSHGAYAHYRPGSGMHTAAQLGRPVAVIRREDGELCSVEDAPMPSSSAASHSEGAAAAAPSSSSSSASASSNASTTTRLLFAGEATLGVTLGCADSAWISGLREAKRIGQLWKKQEEESSAAAPTAAATSCSSSSLAAAVA